MSSDSAADAAGTDAAGAGTERHRTPLILVAGLDAMATSRAANALLATGTALVEYSYDADPTASGAIRRILSSLDRHGRRYRRIDLIPVEAGHISCALSMDLLPLLRRLHRWEHVDTIVYRLDPALEPEAVAVAIDDVVVADVPGFVDGPASLDVQVAATVTCVDEVSWLTDATGEQTIAEAGLGHCLVDDPGDDRTLAQVAVGQVAFADALILSAVAATATGTSGAELSAARDTWEAARTLAVLQRLAPLAPILAEDSSALVGPARLARLLAAIPDNARRGRIDTAWAPLLAGQPPLDEECGVRVVEFSADRPFHPQRLHDAFDLLLDGVVQARGRMWLATRPDEMLFLESAGEALGLSTAGPWLASLSAADYDATPAGRRALASLTWDADYGDRHTSLVVLTHRADGDRIRIALHEACLTDTEMADGQAFWMAYDDPFGVAHTDPCADLDRSDPDEQVSSGPQGVNPIPSNPPPEEE